MKNRISPTFGGGSPWQGGRRLTRIAALLLYIYVNKNKPHTHPEHSPHDEHRIMFRGTETGCAKELSDI